MDEERFWIAADEVAGRHPVVAERPAGSRHPRCEGREYPLDYGYLAGTKTTDGGGIDVWLGSLARDRVTGAITTIDALKGDAEIKLLLGCTWDEAQRALAVHNAGSQAAILLWRGEPGSG